MATRQDQITEHANKILQHDVEYLVGKDRHGSGLNFEQNSHQIAIAQTIARHLVSLPLNGVPESVRPNLQNPLVKVSQAITEIGNFNSANSNAHEMRGHLQKRLEDGMTGLYPVAAAFISYLRLQEADVIENLARANALIEQTKNQMNESQIVKRGESLFEVARKIWPRPADLPKQCPDEKS